MAAVSSRPSTFDRSDRGVAVLCAVALVLSLLRIAAATPAAAAEDPPPALGGQLYSTGGAVTIEVLSASAGLTSQLFLLDPEEVSIASNREVGRQVTVGPYPTGAELIFGIRVQGQEYRLGPANRNPDGLEHAVVDFGPDGCAIVGFEDLYGGGDRDYDDNRFEFCGGIAPDPEDPEEPPTPDPVRPPQADAGADQSVPEGSVVTLDGSASNASTKPSLQPSEQRGTLPGGTSMGVHLVELDPDASTPTATGKVEIGQGPQAQNTSIAYVLDVSGSTSDSASCGGDANGDGAVNRVLDCEVAAAMKLHEKVVQAGTVDKVAVIQFSSSASARDLDPTSGTATLISPTADKDADGVLDVVEGLRALRSGGGTNFVPPASVACSLLATTDSPNLVAAFLSDGQGGGRLSTVVPCDPPVVFKAFAAGSGSSCNAGSAGSRLNDLAALSGGTCLNVPNVENLPDILPEVISSTITKVEYTLDAGAPVDISPALGLPLAGPGEAGFAIELPADLAGSHRLCVTVTGRDAGGLSTETTCSDLVTVTGELTYDWRQVESVGPPIFLSSRTTAHPSFVAPDDGTYVFELTISDGTGGTATDRVTVEVTNVDPVLEIEPGAAYAGGVTQITGTLTDEGWQDSHTVRFDWGDGTVDDVEVTTRGAGWGSFFGSHVYRTAGTYQAAVTLLDDDGGRDIADLSGFEVGTPVAVWANSTSLTRSLDWSGGEGDIRGRVHTNGQLRFIGARKSVVGPTTYAGRLSADTTRNSFLPAPATAPVQDFPFTPDIAAFRPGGAVAVEVGPAYHDMSSRCADGSWHDVQTVLESGVYYASCDIQLNGSDIGGRVTLVSEGHVKIAGSRPAFEPYADGLLIVAGATGPAAIDISTSTSKFLGVLFAAKGEISIAGADNRFYCGILGDQVRITGTDIDIRGAACGRPDATVANPVVVPDLTAELAVDRPDALPSDTLGYSVDVTNEGTTLVVPALVGLENVDAASASVTGYSFTLERQDAVTGVWSTLAAKGDPALRIDLRPNPYAGVTYPSDGGVAGTSLPPGGWATWGLQAILALSPAESAVLFDADQTSGLRTRVDFDVDPSSVQARRLYTIGDDFLGVLRDLTPDVTAASATLVLPSGEAAVRDADDDPALAAIAPGETATLTDAWDVPVPAARSTTETDAGYLSRLLAQDGTRLNAASFVIATGGVGRLVAPLSIVTTKRHLPVVGISTTGPEGLQSGSSGDYAFDLANLGSSPASDLVTTASAGDDALTVSGAPDALEPGESARATTSYTAPPGETGPIGLRGEATWTDARGNQYGENGSTLQVLRQAPAQLGASLTDTLQVDVDGNGSVGPGDTVRYALTVRNSGGAALTDVAATVPVDEHTTLVPGSGQTPDGGTVSLDGDQVEASLPSVAGGGSRRVLFDVKVADPFPNGVVRIQAQGTVRAVGQSDVLTDDPALPGASDPTRTTVTVPRPALAAFLAGHLVIDADGTGTVTPGDTLAYELQVNSVGTQAVDDVVAEVPAPAGTTLVAGSVTSSLGTVDDGAVSVALGTLAPFQEATIRFRLKVDKPLPVGVTTVSARAEVRSAQLPVQYSDDATTVEVGDPTVIPVGEPGTVDPEEQGPVVSEVLPAEGTTVTEPIHITAQLAAPDGATLDSWVVDYRLAGDAAATVIGSGTGGDVDAVLDPTVMPNGTYVVSVRGTTVGGGLTTRDITVVVEGDMKLGRYQTTVTDMSVGVAGLPIQVNRSYDSFDKATGDFGVGWTVDLANFKVSSNGRLGEGGWTMQTCGGGLIYVPLCFTSDRPHFVTVTWPDGRNEYFDMTPAKTWSFIPGMTTAEFTARSGSTSTLKAVDPSLFLFGDNLEGGFFGSDGIYDPRQFVLTDRFGTKYTLEVGVGLKRVEDPTGAVTTFSRNGITSSRGPGVDFARDDQGRITKVTGPDGRTVLYGYDAAGDLATVTDEAGKVTALSYLPGHYLDKVAGPGGATMARFEYTDGRLTAVLDGEGNRTEISSSVGARQETVTDPGGRRTTIKSYDDAGLLVSVNEVYGGAAHVTEYEYDADRNVTLRRDPAGHEWRSTYDDGNITSIELPSGATTEVTYNSSGQPLTWTDAGGNATTYAWNANGTLASVTDPLGNAETYTYNASGMRTGKTDRNGEVWAWTYTAGGLVSTETDPLGRVTRYEYDASGRRTAVVDPAGNRTETAYDASGNAIRVTDADGAVSRTEFDELNRVLREIDPMGHAIDFTYDGAGRTTRVDNHVDAPTAYEYDAMGRQTSASVGSRPAATTTYDGAGHVLTRTDEVGRTTSSSYYPDGSLHTTTNPAGGVTTYTYTPDGKVASVEDPAGGLTLTAYSATGKVHTVTDPLGAVTTHEYDAAGRLTATVHADGSRTERTYDDVGNLTSVTDQNGETTTFELDALGRRVAEVDPEGRRTETTYGPAGRPTTVTAPDGGETVSAFSPGGRLLSTTTPGGVRTTYGYNANGLLTSTTNELGHTWSTTYDPLGRVLTERDPRQQGAGNPTVTNAYNVFGELVSTTDVAGNQVSFGYDAAGQRTSVTDPRGKVWSVDYGPLGGVVSETDPLGRDRTTEYDDSGRATRSVDQRGVAVGYDYDAAGRLVAIDNEDGAGDLAFGYDALGRRTSMTDATGSTGWTYQPNGAVTSVESPAGTVDYTYDGSGRRLTMTQPAGTVEYSYDSAGRLDQVLDWDGRTFDTTFDRDGRVAALVRPNGVRSEWTYDDAGRLTGLRHLRDGNVIQRSTYTLDADGNRTSMTSSAGVETYTINALDQVTAVTYPGGSTTSYTYDAAGNRLTSKKGSNPVVAYTYDDASQLTSVGGSAVTHDAAGNVTGAQGTTYDWDWLQRLVRVDGGGHTSTFAYDGDGVRTSRTVDGATEELLYDRASDTGLPALIADGDQSFLHLLGGVLEEDGSTTLYPLADALGSVRTLTDASGATTGTASYDVFGAVRSSTGTDPAFGFTGAPQDGDLVHLNARDLSTSLGAFLSTDPVRPGSPGVVGWNPYSYVANNPTTWTDPSGQFALALTASPIITFGGVYAIAALGVVLAALLAVLLMRLVQVCTAGGCTIDPPWGGNGGNNGGSNGGGGGGADAAQLAQRYLTGSRAAGLTEAMAKAAAAACLAAPITGLIPQIDSPCERGIGIYFVGGLDQPNHMFNAIEAQTFNPSWLMLHRQRPPRNRDWLDGVPECQDARANGLICDEFPFASTTEAGPGAFVRGVTRAESDIQRNTLARFYNTRSCGAQSTGDPFLVIPVPTSVTFHYCPS